MKIFHFILGKAAKDRANGVNQVVAGLAKYSIKAGNQVRVIGKAQTAACEGEVIAHDGFNVIVFTKWSRALHKAVVEAVKWADVVHLHGTYAPHNIWLGRLCEKHNKPYVITLHGGLSSARKTRRNWLRKTVFHLLLQKRNLSRASLIHCLTEEESTDLYNQARPTQAAVIPNGVDRDDFPSPSPLKPHKRPIRIGYIGRLSREKNLHALCSAFHAINKDKEMKLLLAGPKSLEGNEILRNWPNAGISLVGPKFGNEKRAFLEEIDLFVQPSKTDVFSIAAMEVLACGKPMVITRTSDASHFYDSKAFIMCEPTAYGIEKGLNKALSSKKHWPEMASRGRQLIDQRMNWDAAAKDLIQAYERITKDT